MLRTRRFKVAVAVVACIVGAIVGATIARSAGKTPPPSAVGSFAVFSKAAPAHGEAELADLAASLSDRGDMARLRVLSNGLGRFNSRLVAFPSRTGGTVCYALLGQSVTDPAASYCFQPKAANRPAPVAGEHFSPMALYSLVDGQPGVQLFGVAFDDVASARVNVAGTWRSVPIGNNGFYLDLSGVSHEQVGMMEATLRDGTVQQHDIRTGG